MYGVPVCMIQRANGIKSEKELEGKDTIKIPYPCYCARVREKYCYDISSPELCRYSKTPDFIEYIVQGNETIFEIADMFCTSVNLLIRFNGLLDHESIQKGFKLLVPLLDFDSFIYKVCPGENLSDISEKFRIEERHIRALNFIKQNENVYPSMRLVLPKS